MPFKGIPLLVIGFPHKEARVSTNLGLAVSQDGTHLVVSHADHTLSVFSLPRGDLLLSFGSKGRGKLQFQWPARLCFSAIGTVLVSDGENHRIQEVTLKGAFVRFIGAGAIGGDPSGIAANDEVIVVGKQNSTSDERIVVFDAATGALVRSFGPLGVRPGHLLNACVGIRFSPDGRYIVVSENDQRGKGRLSWFELDGNFLMNSGNPDMCCDADLEFLDGDHVVVSDIAKAPCCCVLRISMDNITTRFSGAGAVTGKLYPGVRKPSAFARADGLLYVLDRSGSSVYVFG